MKRFILGQARDQISWYRQSIDALDFVGCVACRRALLFVVVRFIARSPLLLIPQIPVKILLQTITDPAVNTEDSGPPTSPIHPTPPLAMIVSSPIRDIQVIIDFILIATAPIARNTSVYIPA